MAKTKKLPLEIISNESTTELHVAGDLLGYKVFQDILDHLKENKERDVPKSIRFVVYTSSMLQMIRYSIPREYYSALEIRSSNFSTEKDVLKDAAGM